MTNFQVGDLIRATQDSEWSWGDSFKKGDQFYISHPNTLHYFKFIKNEDEYFEKVDVETYGRHHTGSHMSRSGWVMHENQPPMKCVCQFGYDYNDDTPNYHGKHRYEDHNVWYSLLVAPDSNFAWR